MRTPREVLKGAKVLSYHRVSTVKQEGSLATQKKVVQAGLKNAGFNNKAEVFEEQASGTKLDREQMLAMIERALALRKQGKKVVIALRDMQRFSRNPYDLGILYKATPSVEESLWANDVPLVSLNENIVTGTRENPNSNGDLMGPLLINIGGQEVAIRTEQTKKAVKQAADDGIIAGTPVNLYYQEPLNPFREMLRMLEAGYNQSRVAERLGRSKSWSKDNRRRLADIRLQGGEKGLEDWLNVTDMIRAMEQANGPRVGGTKRMKAVGRKTSGYLKFPEKYPVPTQEDLDFYFENFKQFQPKR
jgi:DNA invertase Pin-like site-specific DNA recombinase